MMTQVGIDNYYKVPSGVLNSMDVGCSQAQLRFARPQDNFILAVNALQVLRHLQSSVRTAIVNNNHLVLVPTGKVNIIRIF